MMKSKIFFPSLFLSLILSISSFAQCKNFVKKQCMNMLAPYTHNGQLNVTTLAEGENASLRLTFYSGQSYRIAICAEAILGKLNFRILDDANNELYNNKDSKKDYFDFDSKSTQDLIIEVSVPEAKQKGVAVNRGCTSIMIGFK